MNNDMLPLLLITVFKNIIKDRAVSAFINVLSCLKSRNIEKVLTAYADFAAVLYENEPERNLYNYLKKLIYKDENILKPEDNKTGIIKTAEYELKLFDNLLKYDYECIKSILKAEYPENADVLEHLPEFTIEGRENFSINSILKSYQTNGRGIFSGYSAFYFDENREIIPAQHFQAMTFNQLKNYEYQKKVIYNNTRAFIDGKEANNILLYGSRGCGKSSIVKALINEFKENNLKIIQITKEGFAHLSELYDKIRTQPLKFIIFADDISFEEDDKVFSAAKSILEGSLEMKPENAVVYAAANRMHLVKETFSARGGDEVHYNDTIDEAVSLSDRFGITLTFSSLTKNEYLDIAGKIAEDFGINTDKEFFNKAAQFAALKSLYTPRTARQFITGLISDVNV